MQNWRSLCLLVALSIIVLTHSAASGPAQSPLYENDWEAASRASLELSGLVPNQPHQLKLSIAPPLLGNLSPQLEITISNLTERELDGGWTFYTMRLMVDGKEYPAWFNSSRSKPFNGPNTIMPHRSVSYSIDTFGSYQLVIEPGEHKFSVKIGEDISNTVLGSATNIVVAASTNTPHGSVPSTGKTNAYHYTPQRIPPQILRPTPPTERWKWADELALTNVDEEGLERALARSAEWTDRFIAKAPDGLHHVPMPRTRPGEWDIARLSYQVDGAAVTISQSTWIFVVEVKRPEWKTSEYLKIETIEEEAKKIFKKGDYLMSMCKEIREKPKFVNDERFGRAPLRPPMEWEQHGNRLIFMLLRAQAVSGISAINPTFDHRGNQSLFASPRKPQKKL